MLLPRLKMDVVAPCLAPAGPFRGGNICIVEKLLGGPAAGCDRSLGFAEFVAVQFHQQADGSVRLSAGCEERQTSAGVLLPLAHQWDADGADCPSRHAPVPSADVAADPRAAPALLLGACVLVVADEEGADGETVSRVLLTRRAKHLRTFPGAWVTPGGGVDQDEAAVDAARREVKEETGIDLSRESLTPLAAWESAFPTSVAACHEAGGLKRQHIVVYYVARISGELAATARQGLDWGEVTADGVGAEVDCACWLPLPPQAKNGGGAHQVVREIGGGEEAVSDALGLTAGASVEALLGDGSVMGFVDAGVELRGIWPNEHGGGVSRGVLFALAMLARSQGGSVLVPAKFSHKL
jgi:8-oxo-dGTP pyrophosphatase MutT (NUDIX family)